MSGPLVMIGPINKSYCHSALLGALTVKLYNDGNPSCFGYSICNSNMRNLSLHRLSCKDEKFNMLLQCCEKNVLFQGESYQLSLVGITDCSDQEGKEIVSILYGSTHPLLKVIPLSKELLKSAISKCQQLSVGDPVMTMPGPDDSFEKCVGLFIAAVNQIYPTTNKLNVICSFAERLNDLLKSDEHTKDWQRSACYFEESLEFTHGDDEGDNNIELVMSYRYFIQSNLAVFLGISNITLDGQHRATSHDICACGGPLTAGDKALIYNVSSSGENDSISSDEEDPFVNGLRRAMKDYCQNLKKEPQPVSIFVPSSLEAQEIDEMREISRRFQNQQTLALGINLQDEVASFVDDANFSTGCTPPKDVGSQDEMHNWSYECLKKCNDVLHQLGQPQITLGDGKFCGGFPTKIIPSQSMYVQLCHKEIPSLFKFETVSAVHVPTDGRKSKLKNFQAAMWLFIQLCSIDDLKPDLMNFLRRCHSSGYNTRRRVMRPNSPQSARSAFVCFYQLYVETYFRTYLCWYSDISTPMTMADILPLMKEVTRKVLRFLETFQNMHPVLTQAEEDFHKATSCSDHNKELPTKAILMRHLEDPGSQDKFVQKMILNFAFQLGLYHPFEYGRKSRPTYSENRHPRIGDSEVRGCVPYSIDPLVSITEFGLKPNLAGCDDSTSDSMKMVFEEVVQKMSQKRVGTKRRRSSANANPISFTKKAPSTEEASLPKPVGKRDDDEDGDNEERLEEDTDVLARNRSAEENGDKNEDGDNEDEEDEEGDEGNRKRKRSESKSESESESDNVHHMEGGEGVGVGGVGGVGGEGEEEESVSSVKKSRQILKSSNASEMDITAAEAEEAAGAAAAAENHHGKSASDSSSGDSIDAPIAESDFFLSDRIKRLSIVLEGRSEIKISLGTIQTLCDLELPKINENVSSWKKEISHLEKQFEKEDKLLSSPGGQGKSSRTFFINQLEKQKRKIKECEERKKQFLKLRKIIQRTHNRLAVNKSILGYVCIAPGCKDACSHFSLYCPQHRENKEVSQTVLYSSMRTPSNFMGIQIAYETQGQEQNYHETQGKPPCSFLVNRQCQFSNNDTARTVHCRRCFKINVHEDCYKRYISRTKSDNRSQRTKRQPLCFGCLKSEGQSVDYCINCLEAYTERSQMIENPYHAKTILESSELNEYGQAFLKYLSTAKLDSFMYYICTQCLK